MPRRRRARYTWLPQDPTYYESQGEEPRTYYWTFLNDGEVIAIPILPDQTYNDDTSTATDNMTLRDYVEGQDYVVKRIVGKMWGSALLDSTPGDAITAVPVETILCMAMAVLPCNDDGTVALDEASYDPLDTRNSMNPWIWRRTWILSNSLSPAIQYNYPTNIGAYGSVMDGGHVDSKVARRVTREQRLFHVATCRSILVDGEGALTSGIIHYGFDLRCLGAMRKHRNRSTFS